MDGNGYSFVLSAYFGLLQILLGVGLHKTQKLTRTPLLTQKKL